MTDDNRNHGGPILGREQAPDHGPDFWANLETALAAEESAAGQSFDAVPPRLDRTAEMVAVESQPHRGAAPTSLAERRSPAHRSAARQRRIWPMAAAAAVLAVLGLGALVLRGSQDPNASTEVVAGPTVGTDGASLDGPNDESPTGDDGTGGASTDDAASATTVPTVAPSDATDDSGVAAVPVGTPGAADSPAQSAAPAIPYFDPARGAIGDPEYLPLDQGLPAHSTYLANWPERSLTWFATTDLSGSCADGNYAQIRYVNASGLTQELRDPQLVFSGEISHFVVHPDQQAAAWVVACGSQLELYVATLDNSGRVDIIDLVWLGEGSTSSALVLWAGSEVNLNAIEPGGEAFAVAYDTETKLLSRNGGPSRIMLEAGAPAERSLTPLAATPDGGLTYWAGRAPAGTVSECAEQFGSGVADGIWLRQGEGQWQRAIADGTPTGTVTAAAISPTTTQIAFADVCPGASGRVIVGNQTPDGRIAELREIPLTAYVPGYVEQLFWVDETTLRIETNNTEYGFGTVRFDFRLDESLVVQLD